MKNVGLLIRREVSAYLRTPAGYLIAASVLLLDGLFFTTMAIGDAPKLSAEVLQEFFFWAGGLTSAAAVFSSNAFVRRRAQLRHADIAVHLTYPRRRNRHSQVLVSTDFSDGLYAYSLCTYRR
jgi:hypothetical protein